MINESEESRNTPWMDGNRMMTQCYRKDTKLSHVQLQKQLEPTDKCASCHEACDSKTVCGDMMVPTIKRQRGKLQTERMQISHGFPSASNHFTHCWADTQNSRRQNSLVDSTVKLIHFQSVHGILSTGHVDNVRVVLEDSRHNQQVQTI